MRIALCLSGQPRTWRHTWPTVRAYFEGHDLDVFIHTWDETDPAEMQALLATYRPRAFRLEPRPLFLEEKRRLAERFPVYPQLTIVDMFHSMAASVDLVLQADAGAKAYDLICRSRFDAIFDGRWNGERPAPSAVIVPINGNAAGLGCNDQFAIGDHAAMRRYAGVAAWLMDGMLTLRGSTLMPEAVLLHYLQTVCGLTVLQEPLAQLLLRDDQVGVAFADLRHDPMFNARKTEAWEAFAKAHGLRGGDKDLDFNHRSKGPLAFDRWLKDLPDAQRRPALTLPWPERLVAIDRLLGDTLGVAAMDAERYGMARMICAALMHRMARDEPMSPQSFIPQALSANALDMRRAQQWVQEDAGRVAQVAAALTGLPMLAASMRFAPPFDQEAMMGWRDR